MLDISFWMWAGAAQSIDPLCDQFSKRDEFIVECMASGMIDPDIVDVTGMHFIQALVEWGSEQLLGKYLSTYPEWTSCGSAFWSPACT